MQRFVASNSYLKVGVSNSLIEEIVKFLFGMKVGKSVVVVGSKFFVEDIACFSNPTWMVFEVPKLDLPCVPLCSIAKSSVFRRDR